MEEPKIQGLRGDWHGAMDRRGESARMFASSLLGTLGERDALNTDGMAYATTLTSISLVTLRESGALGIGGPSAGRFVTGTMEYLVAARSCLALRDGQVVHEPKIRGCRGRAGRAADCAKAFD